MERVDVVVVGHGPDALAAAGSAAAGGARVVLVAEQPLPRATSTLYALRPADLEALEIDDSMVDRILDGVEVNANAPGRLGGAVREMSISAAGLDKLLLARARKAGAEVREEASAVHADVDPDGWRLELSQGEPIRAPIVIVADGARSTMLGTLGIAQAQRFSASAAEVITFLLATWPTREDRQSPNHRIEELGGPLSRIEVLPGRETSTVAFGPIWRGVAKPDSAWPSPRACGTDLMLDGVAARLGFTEPPLSVEVEEWRLDALPAPATFDGGIVIGAAAGHRPRHPLTAAGTLMEAGRIAGACAARCVIEKDWTAANLATTLGEDYTDLLRPAKAELTLEAHGLRQTRNLAPDFWRGLA